MNDELKKELTQLQELLNQEEERQRDEKASCEGTIRLDAYDKEHGRWCEFTYIPPETPIPNASWWRQPIPHIFDKEGCECLDITPTDGDGFRFLCSFSNEMNFTYLEKP